MRKLLLATLALAALLGGPTRAADMAYKAPAAPAPSWAGLYLGINAGGGVATGEFLDNCFSCSSLQINDPAFSVGGQIGYNWQRGNLVYGLEGDFNWIGASQSEIFAAGDTCCAGTAALKMDAFGSIRARLGLAYDRALMYVTAGPAFGHFDSTVALCNQPGCGVFGIHDTATDSAWLPGIALGAGVEYMLTSNLSLRGEFLYMLFRDDNTNYIVNATGLPQPCTNITTAVPTCGVNFNYSAAIARVGLDWKFLPGSEEAAPVISRPIFTKAAPALAPSWAGLYVGLNAGGGLVTGQFLDPCFTCADLKLSEPSFTAGAQVGYNWQWRSAVFGLEGDFNWVGANRTVLYATDDQCCVGTATLKMDSFASIRGRLGLAYDNALLYVTAGPAFGHFSSVVALCTQPGCDPAFGTHDTSTDRAWVPGIAAGAGVEYMLTSNLSLRGEFLYLLFKDENKAYIVNATGLPDPGCAPQICGVNYTYSAAIARVGLNWKFAPGGLPGVTGPAVLPYKAPPSQLAAADWTGFYVGLNAGGGIATGQFLDPCFTCAGLAINEPAFTGGGQVGYNWQWRSLVLGAEGDFNWLSANKSEIFAAGDDNVGTATLKMDSFASIRGRLGLAYDNALTYVTAGPALGHFDSSVALCNVPGCRPTSFSPADTSTDRTWLPGVAAGAGVEFKLTNQLSLRGEFLYLLFKDDNANYIVNATGLPQACPRVGLGGATPLTCGINYTYSAEIARLGLNWKLN